MDHATVASTILAALVPFAKKGAEKIAESIGSDGYEKAKGLISYLKTRWSGDKAAEGALVGFQEDPDAFRMALEHTLKKKLTTDKDLARQLTIFIEEIEPALTVVQKIKTADNITGVEAGEIVEGSVKVSQKVESANAIVGVKVNRLGKI